MINFRHTLRVILASAGLSLLLACSLSATDFEVGSKDAGDTVYFRSTAKLEFIEGQTNNIDGGFSYDFENPADGVKGVIRVDLRTLQTGIEKRDEHMRDNHLHTEDFPYAYFEIVEVNPMPGLSVSDSVYETKVTGNFYIHGVYRKIEAELKISCLTNPDNQESIRVRAKFFLNLDKFKIPRPKALFLKLAETIEVEAVFTGSSAAKCEPVELPDWPELE